MQSAYPLCIMVANVIVLYFLSRHTLNNFFYTLKRTFHQDRLVYILIALFFFPGTLIHELAHYLGAIALLLEVKSIHLLPEWKGNELKLGKVIYVRRDFTRSILVGVAPVIAGIMVLFIFSFVTFFPSNNLWINIASVYVLLVVSTMMFSSRQDLIDVAYLVPVIVVACIVCYILRINPLSVLKNNVALMDRSFWPFVNPQIQRINTVLFITISIHLVASAIFWMLRQMIRT